MKNHASLNHIYRLVWSKVTGAWVAVAETCRGFGKGGSRKAVIAFTAVTMTAMQFGVAQADPTGGQVTSGSATITQSSNLTTINQATQNASLSWQTFNVGTNQTVNFVQPNAAAIAVNRIYDNNGSQIMGNINANGKVFLINPNGILFGPGAQINVGGLIASTLNMSDASLNSAIRQFSGNGLGSIINQGVINTPEGGYVALLGNTVSNQGPINAPLGTVAFGAGSAVTLTFDNNSLVQLQIDQSTLNNLAKNKHLIKADGGMVIMSAGAKDSLLASVVNNTGIIEALTVQNIGGKITLLAGMAAGTTNVAGTLDASAPNGGNGGFIETSASQVKIADSAKITTLAINGKTGNWLIDPTNFTISSGTGASTTSSIGVVTLQTELANSNITIQTSSVANGTDLGDINVNAPVSWNTNLLTLTAANNINVNAVMNVGTDVNSTATLAMNTGSASGVNMGFNANGTFSGQVNFTQSGQTINGNNLLTINGNVYTVINNFGNIGSINVGDFQAMGATGNYALGNSLSATGIPTNGITAFKGMFNGLGHTITGVNIISAAAAGLFGTVGVGSTVQNIGLIGGSVQGGVNSGGLIGWNYGTVSNTYNTGTVSSTGGGQGGLIGENENGNVINSYATGAVSGAVNVGGLIGGNMAGQIINDYATGNVTSLAAGIGGLVGYSTTGAIIDSYATGDVAGATGVGGLLGGGTSGNVTNSHATGNIIGTTNTGGLVGSLTSGIVSKSYATGTVGGTTSTGGLVGITTGAINTSYATGAVTGATNTGGLVSNSTGSVTDSYATGSVIGSAGSTGGLIGITTGTTATSYATGQVNSTGAGLIGNSTTTVTDSYFNKSLNTGVTTYGTGLSTAQMLVSTNYVGFNISNVGSGGPATTWLNYDGVTNPLLTYWLSPVTLTSKYSGTQPAAFTKIWDYTSNVAIDPNKLITISAGLTLSSTSTPGSETAILNGFGTTQQGYNISYEPTTITGTGSLANDLNISTPIYWTQGNLILSAQKNINFNALLSNSASNLNGVVTDSTAHLTLNYGLSAVAAANPYDYVVNNVINLPGGQNLNTTLGSNGITKNYMVVTKLGAAIDATTSPTPTTLQGMSALSNLGGNFVLGNNIDASATANSAYNGSAGFIPAGTLATPFTGYFDGLGHTITNLNFDMGETANAGLFGYTMGPTRIQNVGLIGGSMNGGAATGGLVGYNDSGLIRNSYNTGNVTGAVFTGGLVGQDISGTISNSYATGIIVGAAYTGGLLGGGTVVDITNSYATGSVHGAAGTGGLVGAMTTGTVDNSYAKGAVLGGAGTGGLVGTITTGPIINSYATGKVTGTVAGVLGAGGAASVGGLVGSTTGKVSVSYASGAVSGGAGVGGLIGSSTGSTLNTYATGKVTADTNAGGLIGNTTGPVENSYASGVVTGAAATTGALIGTSTVTNTNNFFDSQSNPVIMPGVGAASIAGGVTGMSSANMMLEENFTTSTNANGNTNPLWDFQNTWIILPETMPFLRTFMTSVTVTANSANTTYSGLAYVGGVAYSLTPTPTLSGVLSYSYLNGGVTTTTATNAGSYVITPSGLLSTQQYLVTFVNGNFVISPKSITVTDTAGSTTYNGTSTYANLMNTAGFTNPNLVGSDAIGSVTQVATISSSPVSGVAQAGSFVSTPSIAVLSTGLASNYDFTYVSATNTVAQAGLAITGTASLTGNPYTGNVYTSAYTTNFLGSDATSALVTGMVSQTNAGTYTSGLGVTGAVLSNYSAPVITDANFVISPKSITVTDTAGSTTYNGTSTYANLMNTAGFTNPNLVGSDAIGSVTQVATISSSPVSGVAQAGSFVSTPSIAVLSTGLASNYDFTYVSATNTVAQAGLAITGTAIPADAIAYSSLKIVQDEMLCPAVSNIPLLAETNVKPSAISNKCATVYLQPSLQILDGGVLLPVNNPETLARIN